MWDETDYEGRWIQAICGLFLLPLGVLIAYYAWTHPGSGLLLTHYGAGGLGIGSMYLGVRCL